MTIRIIRSITAREIFQRVSSLKKALWVGGFWTSGFYIRTVGWKGNEETIQNYVENQNQSNE